MIEERILQRLIQKLGDESKDVRWAACIALGTVKPLSQKVVSYIVQGLHRALIDTDEEIQELGAQAVVNLTSSVEDRYL